MKLTLIADDLTGANDSGVQLAKCGLHTFVFMNPSGAVIQDCDAAVMDTDSRSLPAAEAYRLAKAAAEQAKQWGARLVYKKIDSTMRGNIGSELDAMVDIFQPDFVVVTPAFPRNGRTVRNGHLFVHGIPVHETEMARDPKTPVLQSGIPDLIALQSGRKTAVVTKELLAEGLSPLLSRMEDWLRQQVKYLVLDAESEEELAHAARLFSQCGRNLVWCGSAGLAFHLVEAMGWMTSGRDRTNAESMAGTDRPVLAVVGSVSPRSRKQLDILLGDERVAGIKLHSASVVRGGDAKQAEQKRVMEAAKEALDRGLDPVLYSSGEPKDVREAKEIGAGLGLDDSAVSNRIAEALGEAAARIVLSANPGGLVMTGGDTAKQVCRFVGATHMRLQDEIETGVPLGWLAMGPNRDTLPAVTKAGSFGTDEVLLRALRLLRGEKR